MESGFTLNCLLDSPLLESMSETLTPGPVIQLQLLMAGLSLEVDFGRKSLPKLFHFSLL